MKRTILGTALALLAAAGGATPAKAVPSAGDNEVAGGAAYVRTVGAGSGGFNFDAYYGKYLDDPSLQVGIRQGFVYLQDDQVKDVWNATTTPFLNYHFISPGSNLVPYLGGFGGVVWNEDDFTGTIGPNAGLKAFVSDSTFLGVNYRYEWFFDEIGEGEGDHQDANHVTSVNFGYLW